MRPGIEKKTKCDAVCCSYVKKNATFSQKYSSIESSGCDMHTEKKRVTACGGSSSIVLGKHNAHMSQQMRRFFCHKKKRSELPQGDTRLCLITLHLL